MMLEKAKVRSSEILNQFYDWLGKSRNLLAGIGRERTDNNPISNFFTHSPWLGGCYPQKPSMRWNAL